MGAKEFNPVNLDNTAPEIKSFRPQQLKGDGVKDYDATKKEFGSLATTDPASNPHFMLHADSRRMLGVDQKDRGYIESMVRTEVEERIEELRQKAYDEGYAQGLTEGKTKAEADFSASVKPVFERIVATATEFDGLKDDLYAANERALIQIIFNIGKQVILKELKVDHEYIKRLSVQIVEKIGTKEQIRIKMNREDFANVETIREFLKAQLPELKNIQIEPSDDLALGGCKVETDLSRINASVESQFSAIEQALSRE